MILDRIENTGRYAFLNCSFESAVDCLKRTDICSLPPGDIRVYENLVYGYVKEGLLQTDNENWGTHRKCAEFN